MYRRKFLLVLLKQEAITKKADLVGKCCPAFQWKPTQCMYRDSTIKSLVAPCFYVHVYKRKAASAVTDTQNTIYPRRNVKIFLCPLICAHYNVNRCNNDRKMYYVVSTNFIPRPHPRSKENKRVWWLWIVCLVRLALGVHADADIHKQISEL